MRARGFTLIEVMIAIAILAIVAAIAVPAYNGYIRESRLGAMRMNLDTLRIAVEAFKLESPGGTYKANTALSSYYYSTSSTTIKANYGWQPDGSETYSYTLSGVTATVYNLLVEQGTTWWVRCQKDPAVAPPFKCCATGDASATKTACP